MKSIYQGIQLNYDGRISREEAEEYADAQIAKWHGRKIVAIRMEIDPVDSECVIVTPTEYRPFERIRRITGYLVGSTDRWSNAKQAEERDRVKHG